MIARAVGLFSSTRTGFALCLPRFAQKTMFVPEYKVHLVLSIAPIFRLRLASKFISFLPVNMFRTKKLLESAS